MINEISGESEKRKHRSFAKQLFIIFLLCLSSVSLIQRVRAIKMEQVSDEDISHEKIGKTTIKKDVENKRVLKISSPEQLVNWNVTVNFGYPLPENESILIFDQVDENLSIEKIEICNQDGQSVIDNGTLSIDKNKVVFELEKKDKSYTYLENERYKMTITTKVK